jgi:hypothetical protein
MDIEQRLVSGYFVGEEVEQTICFGKKTLFVTEIYPNVVEIIEAAKRTECCHVYLGANQSFMEKCDSRESDSKLFSEWYGVIKQLLDNNFWVTLDADVKYAPMLATAGKGVIDHDKFVLMLSVKLPNIKNFNYNTTIKLDDTKWGHSNAGVWVHQLSSLKSYEKFTHWEQYSGDTKI